jgi:hypothetical protein
MTRLSESRTRKTSSLRGPRAGARPQAKGRSSGKRAAGAVARPVEDGIAQNREEVGGQLPDLNGFAVRQGIVAGPAPRPVKAPVSDPLLAMRARFLSDFAEWLIGRHPDTYKPRERILRQWTDASRQQGGPAPPR